MLAGLTLSMMMTCLLQNMEVDRATPRLEPVALATSTSRGPDAVATESERGSIKVCVSVGGNSAETPKHGH